MNHPSLSLTSSKILEHLLTLCGIIIISCPVSCEGAVFWVKSKVFFVFIRDEASFTFDMQHHHDKLL